MMKRKVGGKKRKKWKKSNILLKNRVCSNHTQKIWFSYIGVMCIAGLERRRKKSFSKFPNDIISYDFAPPS